MSKVKVILFRKNKSIVSKCISIVTGSNITHSAVLIDGQLYDSSEKRGSFGKAKIKKLQKRKVEVYNIGASDHQAEIWMIKNNGKKYDYRGVLQWLLFFVIGRFFDKYVINSKKRVYCFEATGALITQVTGIKMPVNISGNTVKRMLGKPEFIGELKEYIEHGY